MTVAPWIVEKFTEEHQSDTGSQEVSIGMPREFNLEPPVVLVVD